MKAARRKLTARHREVMESTPLAHALALNGLDRLDRHTAAAVRPQLRRLVARRKSDEQVEQDRAAYRLAAKYDAVMRARGVEVIA